MDSRDEPLRRAIKIAGTSSALAALVGVTPQAVSQWPRVPASRVLLVERATGVSRHELRPDIYGPLEEKRGEAA
ncbi:Cro/CI family transcriptional regulator [Xanthobacter sp. DSM 24535]|uniref:transcriptional regulator n=1 Tax=Roseixanthobacter psychrophilus TaxID=3119917 RepID=UPI00372703CB